MKATLIALIPFILLAAACGRQDDQYMGPCCAPPPPLTPEQRIGLRPIIDKDGCKVYRFEDERRTHYYTTCAGGTDTTHTERVGKTSREVPETITTTRTR